MATLAERLGQPDVAGLPEWRIVDILNAPDPANGTKRVDVATSDARGILLASGEWANVILGAEGAILPPGMDDATRLVVRGACILVRDTLMLTETIQASNPERYARTQGVLFTLVSAGLLSQATVNSMLALADVPMSWAEANSVVVTVGAISAGKGG